MKIAIVTEALADYVSGGILCIVSVLNELKKRGHDVCSFIKNPPYISNWIKADFPIYPIEQMKDYDGILVAAFSPIAENVVACNKAQDRFYWVHTAEHKFTYNGSEWTKKAEESYRFPLKLFCTSTYVQILMEMQFNRYVIGRLVSPGVDTELFSYKGKFFNTPFLKVGVFMRGDHIRGNDVALQGINLAQSFGAQIETVCFNPTSSRKAMSEFYKSRDVFVDMSRLAGASVCVREAMACGNIVLCTKYGNQDIILNDYNGYIVPVDDIYYLANLLKNLSLYKDQQELYAISKNASRYIQNHLTWQDTTNMFEQAIQEGLARKDLLDFRK